MQPDGKVLVGHFFAFPPTQFPENRGLFRLNSDGSVDAGFTFEPRGSVGILRVVGDGKILCLASTTLRRVLPNGADDPVFNEIDPIEITALAVQADGKIIIAGSFQDIHGVQRPGFARLMPDGSLDFSFNPASGLPVANSIALQSDGRILVSNPKVVNRYSQSGQFETTFSSPSVTESIAAVVVDSADRIYFNESQILLQYSGRPRLIVPPAETPLLLERSSAVDSGWSPLQTIPANIDTNYPGANNTFYRTRPAL